MIIKIEPDVEKAKSILKMVKKSENFLSDIEKLPYSTFISQTYYDIIRELCTAILLSEGYKSVGESSHKDLIDFMGRYKKIDEFDISIIQDLRIRRNKSSYEGRPIEKSYLDNKKDKLLVIIKKLKSILYKKLGE